MAEIRPIKRLLIANRGEIATRILSTTRELSIPTYTLHTPSDTLHTHHSTHSIALPSPSSYLDISHLITLVKHYAIDTIHPGYGFLSESAEFSQRMLTEANCHVIGPGPAILSRTGDKLQARALAQECNVPVLPALQNPTSSPSDVETFAQKVGYPIVVKAVDGGGGRGIRIVYQSSELERSVSLALKESPSTLIFAEKAAISGYRHIEVQIIGDGTGAVRHLWERECSIQRRFQKVVEFAPSSLANRRLVSKVIEATLKMARQVRFLSLGTFEFLVSEEKEEYWFLEVNPRIQVEHTVTEQLALGVDLVRLQVLIAQGYRLEDVFPRFLGQDPEVPPPVYSIQLRVTAEDVANNWALSVGKIKGFGFPMGNGVRVDTHLTSGHPAVIGTDFDSLLAKLVISGNSWETVVSKARRALEETWIEGITTNLNILRGILASPDFENGKCDTRWLETLLPSLLKSGEMLTPKPPPRQTNTATTTTAPSTILLKKGDAWSISLTSQSSELKDPILSHLTLTSLSRNAFPDSLSASILYTPQSTSQFTSSPQPYNLALTSTSSPSPTLTSHRRGTPSNPSHILFPFPGTLMELLISVGDIVREGDVVAVVRQMKMELEIRVQGQGGRVVWVCEVEEGEGVGGGEMVCEIEDIGGREKL